MSHSKRQVWAFTYPLSCPDGPLTETLHFTREPDASRLVMELGLPREAVYAIELTRQEWVHVPAMGGWYYPKNLTDEIDEITTQVLFPVQHERIEENDRFPESCFAQK